MVKTLIVMLWGEEIGRLAWDENADCRISPIIQRFEEGN